MGKVTYMKQILMIKLRKFLLIEKRKFGDKIEVYGPLAVDFFTGGKLLPPNVNVRIRLIRSRPQLYLLVLKKYKWKIQPHLFFSRQVAIDEHKPLEVKTNMRKPPAAYNCIDSVPKTSECKQLISIKIELRATKGELMPFFSRPSQTVAPGLPYFSETVIQIHFIDFFHEKWMHGLHCHILKEYHDRGRELGALAGTVVRTTFPILKKKILCSRCLKNW